ncbi:hypothetical protein [Ekhidna sp.]|uniref:hypothetical protein n=1 Tax=Ekhidna sp. TaxID=2608089 RepID=UPI003299B444
MKKFLKIFIVIIFFIMGCDDKNKFEMSPLTMVDNIESSSLLNAYRNYQVFPHRLEDIIWIIDSAGNKYQYYRSSNNISSEDLISFENETLLNLLKDMDGVGAVAKLSKDGLVRFHLNYSDSSYQKLKSLNKDFEDIFMKENDRGKDYNYVVFYDANNDSISKKQIDKLREFASARMISERWYYYRSTAYSSIDKLVTD